MSFHMINFAASQYDYRSPSALSSASDTSSDTTSSACPFDDSPSPPAGSELEAHVATAINIGDDSPPRPSNAFILFRSDLHRKRCKRQEQRKFSSEAGKQWHSLTDEEQGVWYEKARVALMQHGAKYPGYKYTPRRKSAKSRPRKSRGVVKSVAIPAPLNVGYQNGSNFPTPPPITHGNPPSTIQPDIPFSGSLVDLVDAFRSANDLNAVSQLSRPPINSHFSAYHFPLQSAVQSRSATCYSTSMLNAPLGQEYHLPQPFPASQDLPPGYLAHPIHVYTHQSSQQSSSLHLNSHMNRLSGTVPQPMQPQFPSVVPPGFEEFLLSLE